MVRYAVRAPSEQLDPQALQYALHDPDDYPQDDEGG
jgi:hypothetical protein